MGSAAAGHPPPIDKIRLYHLASPQHALSNITNSRLKISRLSDLNDPFELMGLDSKHGQVRKLVREFKETFDSQTGLLCFSEDWTSPVMWSHYAEKHQGICLGFNTRRDLVKKVDYEPKRLIPDLAESDEPFGLSDTLKSRLQRTKCQEWCYEQEWRMFVPLASAISDEQLQFHALNDDLQLVEVILGPNCELPLEDVRALVAKHHPNALTFSARLAWQHFKVVPKESSIP
jgi:hypothetical protein